MATVTTTRPKSRAKAKRSPKARSTKARSSKAQKPKQWRSRAVVRRIEAGSAVNCSACDDHIKFKAKIKGEQVICNIYKKGVWDRVEHFHAACYKKADHPFGKPQE
jgi:hypothetical protein